MHPRSQASARHWRTRLELRPGGLAYPDGVGEPLLVNLALESALSAPDGVTRKSAFEACIATRPTLFAQVEADGDFGEQSRSWIELSGGSAVSETTGTLTHATGPWDADQSCHLCAPRNSCQTHVADGQSSHVMSCGTTGLVRDEGSRFAGSVSHERSGGPASIRVPLLGQLQ